MNSFSKFQGEFKMEEDLRKDQRESDREVGHEIRISSEIRTHNRERKVGKLRDRVDCRNFHVISG